MLYRAHLSTENRISSFSQSSLPGGTNLLSDSSEGPSIIREKRFFHVWQRQWVVMLSWGRQPGLCVCGVCVYQRHIDSNAVWHENPAGFTAVTTQTSHLSLKCLIANLDWVFDAFSIICPHLYGNYTTRDRLQLIFIPRHSSMFLVLHLTFISFNL